MDGGAEALLRTLGRGPNSSSGALSPCSRPHGSVHSRMGLAADWEGKVATKVETCRGWCVEGGNKVFDWEGKRGKIVLRCAGCLGGCDGL